MSNYIDEFTPQLPHGITDKIDPKEKHEIINKELYQSDQQESKKDPNPKKREFSVDTDDIGPSVQDSVYTEHDIAEQSRSLFASINEKQDLENENETNIKREEWMTVPPSFSIASAKSRGKKSLGDSEKNKKGDFDESWTRVGGKPNSEKNLVNEYNKEFRPKTLMEMHLEKLGKNSGKKHKSDDNEWKQQRFSKDRDMKVKWVDTNRQSNVETKYLSNKYGHGKGGSYL
ncbi:hypothetical protein BB558_005000 [Smittium angustum]|uniref:DUF3752 domain-containing protein n=1 Tax=Smittium angustum TaxID=133377 RepID=A0A2U1J1T7_SMIAN|nr:hypothetical protein BB558_005000 [Smittium angustum]